MILVFTAGDGLAGAMTRWWTWSRVGHVAAEVESAQYLDATPARGVAIHRHIAGRIVGRYRVMVPDPVALRAVTWAASQVGQPYDWSAICGIAVHRDWHRPGKWFCSELWATAFRRAGVPLLRTDDLDRVTPRDLLMSPMLEAVE